jgi:pimeloyl-ACP methyl ester carboxylesterase
VLYASTDPEGQPIAVSGVVWLPAGSPPEGGWPVVAWAHPTTGVDRRCAPSLFDDPAAKIPGLEAFLDAGYVVAATDYPGLGTPGPHPYLVGESEGRAVLDSVRAARAVADGGTSEQFAIWGHSQGGHATLWSAQLAADYAPELELVGVAAAAPATELAELFRDDEGTLAGNLLSSLALVSWSDYYAADGADLDAIVEPRARDEVDGIAAGCIETNAEAALLGPDIAALTLGDLTADPTTTPPWSRLMDENAAPTRLEVPVFLAQGLKDTVVHPQITEQVVGTMCADGVTVDFRTFPDASHETISREAAGDVVAWIDGRFAGETAPSTCGDR